MLSNLSPNLKIKLDTQNRLVRLHKYLKLEEQVSVHNIIYSVYSTNLVNIIKEKTRVQC